MSRTRPAAVALLAVCLLGACQHGDPKPNIPDPTTTPQSSSPSPESSSPSTAEPPSMTPDDTIRTWVGAWNQALSTGDTSAVRAFDADSCRGCDELIGPVERIYAAGGAFEGGEWTVDGLKVVDVSQVQAKVNLGADVSAGSTSSSAGASPSAYPSSKHVLDFTLVKDENAWRISVIEVLS